MHLDECLQLAFARPAAPAEATTDGSGTSANADSASSVDDRPENDFPARPGRGGSVLAALHCIASEWGTKSQTNFYIPPENYAGYSYLFDEKEDDDDGTSWQHSFGDHYVRHNAHAHSHAAHHHPTFVVYAEEPNNLHPHHYDVYASGGATTNTTNSAAKMTLHTTTNNSTFPASSFMLGAPILASSRGMAAHANPRAATMITVPYVHPHLDVPVPPLSLPWYFGALCFSFALAGTAMLLFPSRWALRGGGRLPGKGDEKGGGAHHRRHWFPFRSFACALILLQSPCSFLADYVNMTNVSPWHTIDRFLACFMMSLEVVKIIAMRPYTRPVVYLLYLTCCAGAVYCFLKSQEAQKTLSAEGFVFWHNGWHCYPLAATAVFFLEMHLNRRWGEHYSFDEEESDDGDKEEGESSNEEGEDSNDECKEGRRRGGSGILLSTRIMDYWNDVEGTKRPDATQCEASHGVKMGAAARERTWKSVETAKTAGSDGVPVPVPSFGDATGMASPVRRSRRIAGQTPEIIESST